jgi:aspartate/methionine/tyrosine aminotransferase
MKLAARMQRLGMESAFTVLAEVRALEAQGRDIVSLAIGDCDFPTPERIQAAGIAAMRGGATHYAPSAGTAELRAAAAAYLTRTRGIAWDADEIVVTPGAKPIMFYALMAIAEEGTEVIYPNPGFAIYESVAQFAGATAVPLPLLEERGFRFDAEELRRRVTPRTRMIILNSPNNPTGGVLTRSDLEAVAEVARAHDLWVLSDEIYYHYLYAGEHVSIATLPGMKERTILLDGHSKSYAMTGWRLGFGAMNRALAEQIACLVTNSVSCTATFTQAAGAEALNGPQGDVESMIRQFRTRRDLVVDELNAMPGVRCHPPEGAFYAFPNVTEACRRRGRHSAEDLQADLLHRGGVAVLARTCFGSRNAGETEEYLRISFATSEENLREGLRRMRSVLASVEDFRG